MILANSGFNIEVLAWLSTRYQVTRIISVGIGDAEYYGHIGMRANIRDHITSVGNYFISHRL